jgi:hypothetical protein
MRIVVLKCTPLIHQNTVEEPIIVVKVIVQRQLFQGIALFVSIAAKTINSGGVLSRRRFWPQDSSQRHRGPHVATFRQPARSAPARRQYSPRGQLMEQNDCKTVAVKLYTSHDLTDAGHSQQADFKLPRSRCVLPTGILFSSEISNLLVELTPGAFLRSRPPAAHG